MKSKEVESVQKSLTKRRVVFDGMQPLVLLMKLMKVGDATSISLVKVPELDLETISLGEEDAICSMLKARNFPYEVDVWNKKFVLVCIEMDGE